MLLTLARSVLPKPTTPMPTLRIGSITTLHELQRPVHADGKSESAYLRDCDGTPNQGRVSPRERPSSSRASDSWKQI